MNLQYGTRGNPKARVLIVGEAYGAQEEREQQPFVGMSGKELDRILLEAGIDPNDCYFTNVVNKRPPNNDITKFFISTKEAKTLGISSIRGLFPDIPVLEGLQRLESLINELQPQIIVAFGNYALWALTESSFGIGNSSGKSKGYKVPTGIVNFRGSHLRSRFNNIPVLPTYHPAAALRNWPWRTIMVHDLRARVGRVLSGACDWDEPARNYIVQPSFDQVMETLSDLLMRAEMSATPLLVACDIETQLSHIECIGFAWSNLDAICIPIMCADKWEGYWSLQEEIAVYQMIKKVLEHGNIEIVGQNFFYDYQYFWYYYNIRPHYKQDTMLAHHVCFPGTQMSLDYISSMYCTFHAYWKEDGKEAAKDHNDMQRWVYNCRDCVVTYEAITELWKVIKHFNMERQYAIQMVRARSAVQMMVRGTVIDEQRRGEEKIIHMETMQDMENKLEGMLPVSVFPRDSKKTAWYRSNQQLGQLFYNVLGIPKVINHKTGQQTVDDEALGKIANREPILLRMAKLLQQYRSMETFGQFLSMKVGSDKRMRASFSPTTETFRYRSSADVFGFGRNLQNLPKGAEDE